MSKKKNWIMLKRGLSEDAKHREAMGNRIWLFLHLIDRADWDTGTVHDWRDKDEADDMNMSHLTIRNQRQELETMGYITCQKKQRGQNIVIHNWVNPRNYSGEVLNQSNRNQLVSEIQSNCQSNQPSNGNSVTLHIEDHESISASAPLSPEAYKDRIRQALTNGIAKHEGFTAEIESQFAIRPNWDTKTNRAAVQSLKEQGACREQISTFRQWYFGNDWRGKQGQPPTPPLIAELWPQAFKIETDTRRLRSIV